MKLTKKISAVVLAALMAVVAIFAGCSSTKSNDDSKTNNESTTSAAKVKVVDIELSSEEYAFGVDKKQPELKEKCNELLKEMKSNGELDEISNHYFGNGEVSLKALLLLSRISQRTSLLLQQMPRLHRSSTKRATSSTVLIWKSLSFLPINLAKNL